MLTEKRFSKNVVLTHYEELLIVKKKHCFPANYLKNFVKSSISLYIPKEKCLSLNNKAKISQHTSEMCEG